MSLNKLALEMWERLGEADIDPSVVSRVLNGKRLFSFKQLAIFCEVLNIPQTERNLLFSILEREILYREGDPLIYGAWNIWKETFNRSKEGELSRIGLKFNKSTYYKLISDGLSFKDKRDYFPGDYVVQIPVCSFNKTKQYFDDNCHCGYHLALYGVIKRCLVRGFDKKVTQIEIGSWVNYFFPAVISSQDFIEFAEEQN